MQKVQKSQADDDVFLTKGSALLCESLGLGTFSANTLQAMRDDPTYGCFGAWVDGELVGVGIAHLLESDAGQRYAEFGVEATSLFTQGRVGLVDSLAVSPTARGLGLGKSLTLACNDWLREQGCVTSISTSWLSGQEQGSWYLFERLGFERVSTVEDFYVEISLRDGWRCYRCGNPCHCPAALYKLRL